MALQGTIDDFPLTDVLSLLATSSRSGRLLLEGDRGPATLVIDQGHVVGGGPAVEGADAQDLVFELLRHREGSFGFEAADPVVEPQHEVGVDPRPVTACIDDAGRMLERWREIEAVVPSSWWRARLVPELPVDTIELDADDWRLVAAVGGGATIDELRERLVADEFALCEQVADLVRSGLILLEEPESASPPPLDAATWAEPDPAATDDRRSDAAPDASSVGWLQAEDERDADHPDVPVDAVHGDDAAASGAPEHFPIDDLLGGPGEVEDDPWASPEMEQLTQQRSQPVDEVIEFEPVPLDAQPFGAEPFGAEPFDARAAADEPAPDESGDSADEVLRQMSKLSPEAAEAIAAALNSPAAPTATAGDEPDDDGPVTYLGTL